MDMDRSSTLVGLSAQQDSAREHLSQAINHIIEIGRLAEAAAEMPAAPAWYAAAPAGTRLRTKYHTVVYTDHGLTKWDSAGAEKSAGDTTMQLWRSEGDWIMVARPHPNWPEGLWVRAMDVERA